MGTDGLFNFFTLPYLCVSTCVPNSLKSQEANFIDNRLESSIFNDGNVLLSTARTQRYCIYLFTTSIVPLNITGVTISGKWVGVVDFVF